MAHQVRREQPAELGVVDFDPRERRGRVENARSKNRSLRKPRHDFRYAGVHVSRPYPVGFSLPSNQAA
jgi:hypothetical protein